VNQDQSEKLPEETYGKSGTQKSKMDLMPGYDRVKTVIGGLLLSEGLRAKTMRGGAWLGAGSVAEQAARFARNMLLARLLAPGAFGTMAIVISSASLVDTLTDVGQKAAIIQNPRGGEKAYLNASWWLGMGRAIFSYSIIFTLAPWISQFYGRPELAQLLRVALLGILFNGAMSPRSILAQKEMRFARWTAITNGGGVCGVILTVILSFFIRDVWALVIGYCSEHAFRCLLSYTLRPGLPSLQWDWHAAREILTFSRGIVGLSFLNLVIGRADVFVLAKLYSSATLGLYTMAVFLVTTPSVFFTGMLGQALIPALSSVQEDVERLNRILMEVTSWLVLLGLPAVACICLTAPHLLALAYGSRYAAAVGPLSLASAAVFLTVLHATTTCVLFAKGRPALHRHAVAATAVTMVIAIYPACRFLGPVGGQVAALLAIAVGYLLQLILLRGVTGLKLPVYLGAFVRPGLAVAGILGVVLGSRRLGLATRPIVDLAFCLGSCAIACAVCASAHLTSLRSGRGSYSAAPDEVHRGEPA
jgi:O-antigen/teichoic acid export membrane protein